MSHRRCLSPTPRADYAPIADLLLRCVRQAAWVSLSLAVLAMAGCKGCNSTDPNDPKAKEEARKKLEEEKKKKDELEIGMLQPLVGQELSEDEMADGKPKLLIKPGHWMPTARRMKANFDDFVFQSSNTLVDDNRQAVKLPLTPFTFELTRPVVLAKGRAKNIHGEVFIPEDSSGKRLRSTLVNTKNRSIPVEVYPGLVKMPPYQYFLLVLATEPDRYAFLKVTDTVRSEWEEDYNESALPHYRVALADAGKDIPLSPNVLSWSTIAAIVWDEVDSTRLTSEQQAALLDWLHWGGRLIVNGPDSLETLRGSFLADYLPVDSDGVRNFTAADLRQWSSYWGRRAAGKEIPPLEPVRAISGVKLVPRDGAREIAGGGSLFYETNVGLGTIVVSSIQLSQRDFINWPGYDSFLNSGLLSRPRRRFQEGPYDGIRIGWSANADARLDAHHITGLRMMSRDAGAKANTRFVQNTVNQPYGFQEMEVALQADRKGGVAAWNSFSDVSNVARNLLLEAAGVEMPDAGFVLFCVGVYLVVLVPLNWMIFRTIGRVELAWLAAPFIAILGTYGVVWMAQLDIGFVRAQTEIALLELHGNYPRGILSRYTAFYSSLSTTYDVEYEVDQSVASPFPTRLDANDPALRDERYDVSLERHTDTNLQGLAISSNSTRMLQSEQVLPLEGKIKLGTSSRGHTQVENLSGLDLRDVMVIRRYFPRAGEGPVYQASWIGALRSGSSEVLGLTGIDYNPDRLPFAEQRSDGGVSRTGLVNVDELIRIACRFPAEEDPRYNRREEYRLVGRIDEVLPGMEANPDATQVQGVTVVVAHLQYGATAQAKPDVNSRGDVVTDKPGPFDD